MILINNYCEMSTVSPVRWEPDGMEPFLLTHGHARDRFNTRH